MCPRHWLGDEQALLSSLPRTQETFEFVETQDHKTITVKQDSLIF